MRIYMAPTADCMNPSFSDTLFGISSTYRHGHTLFQTKNVSHAEVPNVNIKSGQAYVESSLSFCEESDDLKNAWNQSHTHSTHTHTSPLEDQNGSTSRQSLSHKFTERTKQNTGRKNYKPKTLCPGKRENLNKT